MPVSYAQVKTIFEQHCYMCHGEAVQMKGIRLDQSAVVKANAYGHGAIPVANAALNAGAEGLCVALMDEGVALRRAGVTAPILVLSEQPAELSELLVGYELTATVTTTRGVAVLANAASAAGKVARVHVKVDTGMHRIGVAPRETLSLIRFMQSFDSVLLEGVYTHFAVADSPEHPANIEQLRLFNEVLAELAAHSIEPPLVHAANSAAALANPDSRFSMVRLGIAMYGLTPDVAMGSSKDFGLRPAMQLRAALYLVKDVPANTPVGYGATESTTIDTRLGVVTMGYADGIPRIARSAGVWHNGKRAPIIGRVSMDQFVVDLGPDSKAQSGDWVTIFGNGSHGEYTADDWGAASQSINYEIVTRIGSRVPRIYSPHIY